MGSFLRNVQGIALTSTSASHTMQEPAGSTISTNDATNVLTQILKLRQTGGLRNSRHVVAVIQLLGAAIHQSTLWYARRTSDDSKFYTSVGSNSLNVGLSYQACGTMILHNWRTILRQLSCNGAGSRPILEIMSKPSLETTQL